MKTLARWANFGAGAAVSNAVVVKLSSNGRGYLWSTSRTDLAVDVVGYSVDNETLPRSQSPFSVCSERILVNSAVGDL